MFERPEGVDEQAAARAHASAAAAIRTAALLPCLPIPVTAKSAPPPDHHSCRAVVIARVGSRGM
jgi:hypothetical protein